MESPAVGAGVEFDSEALSLTSGTFSMEESSGAGAGDEADDGVDCSSDLAEGSSKRRRIFGDSLRMTIFPCFLFLSARATEAEGERVLEDDMAMNEDRNGDVEVVTVLRKRGGFKES